MQLIALDGQIRVLASVAAKNSVYLCPECLSPLRVRSGPHRQPHFYHPSKNPLCRQNGKSLQHLNTQIAIQNQLPPGEAELEVSFPKINRIADVVWVSKKIVFEVQCSAISPDEVSKRFFDYESLGLTVIWILHDKRYNRRAVSSAEAYLVQRDIYYCSFDDHGVGTIYDQFSLIQNHRRLFKGAKLSISLSSIYSPTDISYKSEWPHEARKRISSKRLGFRGDLLDRLSNSSSNDWLSLKRIENRYSPKPILFQRLKNSFTWVKNVYLSLLHALLEKHSV